MMRTDDAQLFLEMANVKSYKELWDEGLTASVDWKAPPMEVLERIDRILKQYGLEVRVFPAEGDDYHFTVKPIGYEGTVP